MVPRAPDSPADFQGKGQRDLAGTVRMRGPHGVRVPSPSLRRPEGVGCGKESKPEKKGKERKMKSKESFNTYNINIPDPAPACTLTPAPQAWVIFRKEALGLWTKPSSTHSPAHHSPRLEIPSLRPPLGAWLEPGTASPQEQPPEATTPLWPPVFPQPPTRQSLPG